MARSELLRARPLTSLKHRSASAQTLRDHALFPALPLTVFQRILATLPRHDVASLLRVNSAMYWVCLPTLYRHLRLTEYTAWPAFKKPRNLYPPMSAYCRWLAKQSLPQFVREVDMLPHSTRLCMTDHFTSDSLSTCALPDANCPDRLPMLPNLDTLRLHIPRHTGFHTDEASRSWPSHEIIDVPPSAPLMAIPLVAQCAVLTNLRPRRLVLIGGPSVSSLGLTVLPYGLLAAVDEYVVLLFPDSELVSPDRYSLVPEERAGALAADIGHVNLARSATVVLYTPHPWDEFTTAAAALSPRKPTRLADSWAGRFFGELAQHVAQLGERTRLRIVNAGSVGAYDVGMQAWDAQLGEAALEAHFRDTFRQAQRTMTAHGGRPRARASGVEFLTMEAYLAAHGVDDIGHERAHEWLRSDLDVRERPLAALPRSTPPNIPGTPRPRVTSRGRALFPTARNVSTSTIASVASSASAATSASVASTVSSVSARFKQARVVSPLAASRFGSPRVRTRPKGQRTTDRVNEWGARRETPPLPRMGF